MRITALCYCLLQAMADDDETHFEIRRVQYGRMPLGPDQLFFKPCLVYQKLLDEHVVDAGLELRVDMTTGLKEARFNGGLNISDDSDRARSILARQLKCIDDNDEHARLGDGPTVARRLAAAASWGVQAVLVSPLIRALQTASTIFEGVDDGQSSALTARAAQSSTTPAHFCRMAFRSLPFSIHSQSW